MKSNKKIISIVKYNSAGNTGSLYNALNKLIKNDYKYDEKGNSGVTHVRQMISDTEENYD